MVTKFSRLCIKQIWWVLILLPEQLLYISPNLVILSRGNHTSGRLVQQEGKLSLQNDVLSLALTSWIYYSELLCRWLYSLHVLLQ